MTGGAGGGPLTGLHAASPSATRVAARHAVATRNGLRRAAGPTHFTASSPESRARYGGAGLGATTEAPCLPGRGFYPPVASPRWAASTPAGAGSEPATRA